MDFRLTTASSIDETDDLGCAERVMKAARLAVYDEMNTSTMKPRMTWYTAEVRDSGYSKPPHKKPAAPQSSRVSGWGTCLPAQFAHRRSIRRARQ